MPIVTNDFVKHALEDRAEVASLHAHMEAIREYCVSEKFFPSEPIPGDDPVARTSVNVQDIILRLDEMRYAAQEARDEVPNLEVRRT